MLRFSIPGSGLAECGHIHIAACQCISLSHHRVGGEAEDRWVGVGRGEGRQREARGG